MRLSLENICNIKKANLNINGITVIAGDNATGKSTIGKALHLILHSFYDIKNRVALEKEKHIQHLLYTFEGVLEYSNKGSKISLKDLSDLPLSSNQSIVKKLLDLNPHTEQDIELFLIANLDMDKYTNTMIDIDKIILNASSEISKALDTDFDEYFRVGTNKEIEQIFSSVINNIYSDEDAKISLHIDNKEFYLKLRANKVIAEEVFDSDKNIIYIANPFIFDDIDLRLYRNFKRVKNYYLIEQLLSDNELMSGIQISVEKKLENILEIINSACKGNLATNSYDLNYKIDAKNQLPIHNVSTGIKSFLIIKTLLLNGTLTEGCTLILDEPEIHLHPEWQLIYAELIILLQKEFNLKILLTTHSPYFIQAIEAYAKKYNLSDKCEYYLSKVTEDGFEFNNVTNNLDPIYQKFLEPLKIIKDIEEQYAN